MLVRFRDSPEPAMVPPGAADRIMHAAVGIGETMVLASDGRCFRQPEFRGFSMSLTVAHEAKADRFFAALGVGGQVQMALSRTFFAPPFGMVADRFGVSWMVYVAL